MPVLQPSEYDAMYFDGGSPKDNPLDIEAEYKELEHEKVVENWRYA